MTPRRRAILIVVLALLLLGIIIAAILYFWPKNSGEAPPIPEPSVPTVIENVPKGAAAPNPLKPVAAAPVPGETAARQMAELFAERYGSYSNQGDFQNLKDLLPVMSVRYRAETEAYLATAQASDTSNYVGVTSVKISTQVRSYDESAGTAVIAVTLQQQKSVGASASPPTYRSLKMELQNAGKGWKIDKATWEN